MALIEAIIDFFPEGKRMLLRRALTKVLKAAERRQLATLDKALQAVESPEFTQAIETGMSEMSIGDSIYRVGDHAALRLRNKVPPLRLPSGIDTAQQSLANL